MTASTSRGMGRFTRRDVLRGSGMALGGLAVGGGLLHAGRVAAALPPLQCEGACYPLSLLDLAEAARQQYSYLEGLAPLYYYNEPYPGTCSHSSAGTVKVVFVRRVGERGFFMVHSLERGRHGNEYPE